MGSGKTSTGKKLARILHFNFLDTDQLIEEKTGKKVSQIFKARGEVSFREEEKEAIYSIAEKKNYVISTGGGIWVNKENRKLLLQMGWCVWLKVSADEVWKRVSLNLSQRPLLNQDPHPYETVKKIIEEREPIYSLAHFSVDTNKKSFKKVAEEIVRSLKKVRPFDLSFL